MAAIAARTSLMSVAWPTVSGAATTIKPPATTATIRTSATVTTATTIPPTAAERALEARTAATTNASGVARSEIFARTSFRGACLARQKNFVFRSGRCGDRMLGFVRLLVFVALFFV